MARSKYVYLVMAKGTAGIPLGAFTVKYEMCDWLAGSDLVPELTVVYRMPGGGGRGVELKWGRQLDGKVCCK